MSTLKADTIVASDGTSPVTLTKQSALKGFQSYDGTGTIAIGDSLNTSSLTDTSTGQYEVNFTNNYFSTDYSNTHGGVYAADNGWYHWYYNVATGSIGHYFIATNNTYVDCSHISGMQTGDLA